MTKEFSLKKKKKGLRGSIQSILKPSYQTIKAVKGINFQVKQGEMLGFIGPNGSGKSTTIKMLSGILTPSEGELQVLGTNPVTQRRKLTRHIGTVYGQKSQLWYHIPPIDTFYLFSKIYEIEENAFKKQLDKLVELFQLENILNVAARKLSLGQRMKCEIAASLLHQPKLVFLDEPTIGLDIIAKQQIREALLEMNRSEGTTVMLTSHDVGDIESLCDRVIVINQGEMVFDDHIDQLKRRFIHHKVVEIGFTKPTVVNSLPPDVDIIYADQMNLKLKVKHGISQLMEHLMVQYSVADLNINEPSMEEVIRSIYQESSQEEVKNA
ncbi:ABC transporter ATP-binding protein [Chengkuizengella marina]|uniref:ABC transporter ATP-binding protein n=1 Tax=Chengkuizengella marina TaxID=2507566 RepID=UPI001F214290|nr:ATP-binding cassette domain-containing protein [Chengkuizengella marina]